jgi:hypothetical protein
MTGILDYLVRSRDTLQAAIDDPAFVAVIRDIVEVTAIAIGDGRKLLLAGNGGSAGDAQHLAGEIVSRMNYDRARQPRWRSPPTLRYSPRSAMTTAMRECSSAKSSVSVALGTCSSQSRHLAAHRTFCGRSMPHENNGSSPSASPAGSAAKCHRAAICAYGRRRIRHR